MTTPPPMGPPPPPDPWSAPTPTTPPPLPPPVAQNPWGQPGPDPTWAMYQPQYPMQQQGTDGFSIAALVLGIIPFFTVVLGPIFGFIALSRIKRSGQGGKGLAIAGIVLGGLWLVLFVAVGAGGGFDDTSSDSSFSSSLPPAVQLQQAEDLSVGDCLLSIPESGTDDVTPISCTQPHAAQVFEVWSLPSLDFPGEAKAQAESTTHCRQSLGGYIAVPVTQAAKYRITALPPTADQWRTNQDTVCLLSSPGGSVLTKSAEGNGPYGGQPAAAPAPARAPAPATESGTVGANSLRTGNCVKAFATGIISTVDIVPCAGPHLGEVFSVYTLPAGAFPGESRVKQLVVGHCEKWLPVWAGTAAGRSGYDLRYIHPTAESWKDGDRVGTCILADPGGKSLVGSAKGRGRHR